MADLHERALEHVLHAHADVLDAEDALRRLRHERGDLLRLATAVGVPIEHIAEAIGIPRRSLDDWLLSPPVKED